MNDLLTILDLGAEGGGLKVLGAKVENLWRFQVVRQSNDWLYELDDEPASQAQTPALHAPVETEPEWFDSITEALASVPWAWNSFYPIEIDPDFRSEIYALKCALDKTRDTPTNVREVWREMCDAK